MADGGIVLNIIQLKISPYGGDAVTKSWQRGLKARDEIPTYLPSPSRTRRASSPKGGASELLKLKELRRRRTCCDMRNYPHSSTSKNNSGKEYI